jgi:hypothetical protein
MLPFHNYLDAQSALIMSSHFILLPSPHLTLRHVTGKLTVQEFKVALKRLHFKDEKKWTLKMIRRLFQDHDT